MTRLGVIVMVLFSAGCGSDPRGWKPWASSHPNKQTSSSSTTPVKQPPKALPKQTSGRDASVPVAAVTRSPVTVETFLVGGRAIPDRLKARTLTLAFRSNIALATFECRLAPAFLFSPCPEGAQFTFNNLADGASATLNVRAKAPSGSVDPSPIVISFVVDLAHGLTVDDLAIPPATAIASVSELLATRSLQLGSFYALAVPPDGMITSFSTDKTYNTKIRILRRLGDDGGSAYTDEPCNRFYEQTVDVGQGATYCDGTPTHAQWASDYRTPMPLNHVEVVRHDAAGVITEKLLLAAFDAEADQAEGHMGIVDVCAKATASGQTRVGIVRDFYAAPTALASLGWCQVQDPAGAWWWIGAFTHSPGDGVRVRGIVALAASSSGVFSGQDFAAFVGASLSESLVPLAPMPSSAPVALTP